MKTFTRWYGSLFNGRVEKRLRSERHGLLSQSHLLITMTGRKTRRQLTIPVNYRSLDDHTVVIGTEASWRYNLKDGADVELVIAGEKMKGYAQAILHDTEKRNQGGKLLCGITWPWFKESLMIIEILLHNPGAQQDTET